jgi:hypothetical protein
MIPPYYERGLNPDALATSFRTHILLEPDATMLKYAEVNNSRLLSVFPKGFALDATHRPHITPIQRFVRTADLDRVYDAVGKVFASAYVTAMRLGDSNYYFAPAGVVGVAGICAKPTPEILKLQAEIMAAVKPLSKAAPSARSPPRMAIPPVTRPSSNMFRRSCRICPVGTSIRTSTPGWPSRNTSKKC